MPLPSPAFTHCAAHDMPNLAGLLLLAGVLAVSGIAALVRRRRRGILGTYTPVATALQWIDSAPTLGAIGATANSRAIVVDQRGAAFVGGPTVSYSSGTTSVATVNSSGVVTSVANGSSVITASASGLTSITQTATVSQVVASISGPTTASTNDTASGSSFSTSFGPYTPKDANGNTVAGATLAYSSDLPSVFQIVNGATGQWAGQGPGTAHVTITSGSISVIVTVTVAHVTYTLTVTPSPITGANGGTVQVTVYEDTGSGPVDVTSDSQTVYSIADTTKATVDVPTLTSISPNTITQGTSASYTFTGTNIKGNETIGSLPSGVTASGYSYTSTTVVCTLTATGSATTGGASVTLVASGRGTSGAQTLTVNSSSSLTSLPVSGAVLRLHAGAGITLNGSTVSAWADQTSTGASFTQGTSGNQPTFVANVYNGGTKPTVRFTGSQWLAMASYLSTLNPSQYTLYIIAKSSPVEYSDRAVFSSKDGTSAGYELRPCDINEQSKLVTGNGSGFTSTPSGTTADTSLHLFTGRVSVNQAFIDIDGVNKNVNGLTPSANTTTASVIGTTSSSVGTSGNNFKGDICEIILFPSNHNSTNESAMHGYAQSEWGTP